MPQPCQAERDALAAAEAAQDSAAEAYNEASSAKDAYDAQRPVIYNNYDVALTNLLNANQAVQNAQAALMNCLQGGQGLKKDGPKKKPNAAQAAPRPLRAERAKPRKKKKGKDK